MKFAKIIAFSFLSFSAAAFADTGSFHGANGLLTFDDTSNQFSIKGSNFSVAINCTSTSKVSLRSLQEVFNNKNKKTSPQNFEQVLSQNQTTFLDAVKSIKYENDQQAIRAAAKTLKSTLQASSEDLVINKYFSDVCTIQQFFAQHLGTPSSAQ